MRLSKRTHLLLRLAVGVGLAFIYIPLIVIAIYAFNASSITKWPPSGLTLDWFPRAVEDEFAREALLTSLKAGVVATLIALVLGTLASLAVARHRFFGRETISFLVVLPIALPGIVTGVAIGNTFTQVLGVDLSLLTVIVGHATFCIVVVYNNAVARLRRVSTSFEEASADLGAHGGATLRRVILPLAVPGLAAGSIFTFSLTLGDYIAPSLVGGPGSSLIGTVVFENLGLANNAPFAAAFATVPLAIMAVYLLLMKRLGAFESL